MATTYTANAKLQKPAAGDRTWNVPVLADLDQLDATAAIGPLSVVTAEIPSASLNVAVAAGSYVKADGTVGTYAGTASQAMTASNTNYVYLTDAGVLTVNTTGWPAASHVRLATVVAGTSTVTSVADARLPFPSAGVTTFLALAGGTFADAGGVVVLTLGTTNGVKIGATASDKMGLWGATPVVQPSGAAQAALGALTAAALTDSTTGTAGTTISDVGAAFSQTTLDNNFASVTAMINKIVTDLGNVRTLVNALQAAGVTAGTIKGSA